MDNTSSGMSTGKIILIGAVVLILALVFGAFGSYNSLVNAKEDVSSEWANIQTQLQRRSDLIPNLVNTVKGYAAHETEIMTTISNARTKLHSASSVADKAEANNELSGALSRLMVIVENYPNLKADSQYTALMDELSGTENRISTARIDYNEQVSRFNKKIKTFPSVIIANMFGFKEEEYFEATQGAETVPTVDFGA